MADVAKATPRPWEIEQGSAHTGLIGVVYGEGGFWEVWSRNWAHQGTAEADARLIVEAVNTYEAHQAVAEAAREALERIADKESGWRFSFRVDPLEHARSVVEEMREVARAALARLDAIEGGGA